ncbi:signal peptidase II [Aliifodinibius sp. S!AR15-10]|uniref:signal peptidase II n=1 Tax=Aliifodinibius sp. S!AR15-10 TaxID=2950437 RepID=UPI0028641D07|nr:signal peptidase II [Aliifodinibius sp. S!AR15-10]MDR8390666.1 signal peptidase II [Aliifodinibius sp. S!AR15-10]
MKNQKLIALSVPALIVIIIDQITKHMVRTTPSLQNWDIIPGWLSFHYTQNPGMALGMDWASTPVISGIAILATIGIIVYILRSLDRANIGYLLCMGLVLGGAFGNIIDRLVMGYIGAYGGILEGHVIDFIHFTLRIDGYPVFPYIFNVADISISVAIFSLLLFHQRILPVDDEEGKNGEPESPVLEHANSPNTSNELSPEKKDTDLNPTESTPLEKETESQVEDTGETGLEGKDNTMDSGSSKSDSPGKKNISL